MPAELTDEMTEEGATKFEDIEGGGIGEGEGVKDVSNQIESEDQVPILFTCCTSNSNFLFNLETTK